MVVNERDMQAANASDTESDCGLVIDEDAGVRETSLVEEKEAPSEQQAQQHKHPPAFSMAWALSNITASSTSTSVTELPGAGKKSGGRAAKLLWKTAKAVLNLKLAEQLHSELGLLQRLYDSIKRLIVFVNGTGTWWEKWMERIRVVFKSYCISQAVRPTNARTLFKKELTMLKSVCNTDLGKWQEQISRYCSLCSTLPKSPSDIWWEDLQINGTEGGVGSEVNEAGERSDVNEMSTRSGTVLAPVKRRGGVTVRKERGYEVLVIDSSDEGEVFSEDEARSVSLRIKQESVEDAIPQGNKTLQAEKPAESHPKVGKLESVPETGKETEAAQGDNSSAAVQDSAFDPEASCGEGSMSVCSVASDDADFQLLDKCQPQPAESASTASLDTTPSASLDTISTTISTPKLSDSEKDTSGPIEASKEVNMGAPVSSPAPSLSSGELTPTPPSSPKPCHRPRPRSREKSFSRSPSPPSGSRRSTHHALSRRREDGPSRARKPLPLPTAYRRCYRRSRSRSRERRRYSRRSGSPVQRSRKRSSRSSLDRSCERKERRRSRSSSIGYGRAKPRTTGRGRAQRREEDEEDLELLQLKKEVILSIVQKPNVDSQPTTKLAAQSSSKDTPQELDSKAPSTSPVKTTPPKEGVSSVSVSETKPSVVVSSVTSQPSKLACAKPLDSSGVPTSQNSSKDKLTKGKKSSLHSVRTLKAQSRNLSPASNRSARSSLSGSRVSSCVNSPVGSPAHSSAALAANTSLLASEELQMLDSIKSVSTSMSGKSSASVKVS